MSRPIHVIALILAVPLFASDVKAQLILSSEVPGGGPLPLAIMTTTVPAPAGALVTIDMSGCPGLVPVPTPGVAVACGAPGPAGNSVSAVAGPAGAVFTVLGYSLPAPAAPSFCAALFVAGAPVGPFNVAAADLNGAGGCNPADGALYMVDYFSFTNPARANYNGIGGVNPADAAIFLTLRDVSGADFTPAGGCP